MEISITIKRGNISKQLEIDTDALTPQAQAYIFTYGFNQTAQDAMASKTKDLFETEEEWAQAGVDAAYDRITNILKGILPSSNRGPRLTDLEKEIRTQALAHISNAKPTLKKAEITKAINNADDLFGLVLEAALEAGGQKVDGGKFAELRDALEQSMTDAAQKAIDARKAGTIDLGALGL